MEDIDYWRLCDELTIVQAAHLIIGMIPGQMEAMSHSGSELTPRSYASYTTNLSAAQTALEKALLRGSILGSIIPRYNYDENFNKQAALDGSIDPNLSSVEVASLTNWLRVRGVNNGFFFPDKTDAPDYLDPNHPRYAPKLAAAVNAWQAVTNPGKKSPKQALEKWLREHASRFGLVDDDGNPVNQAVEDCSKVANWNSTGGAPKTPSA